MNKKIKGLIFWKSLNSWLWMIIGLISIINSIIIKSVLLAVLGGFFLIFSELKTIEIIMLQK